MCHVVHLLKVSVQIVQLHPILVDSGCTKHMTGQSIRCCAILLKNTWYRSFGNDQFAPILLWRFSSRKNHDPKGLLVEGRNHNLYLGLVNSVMRLGDILGLSFYVPVMKHQSFEKTSQNDDPKKSSSPKEGIEHQTFTSRIPGTERRCERQKPHSLEAASKRAFGF
ncbi:hypothetical protein Tco_0677655 [Tanacetum coccineum]|uniref:Uncharacterized protein n=1 Tax=Tanacetum coccineum TaxID=301880 RepID=A0ABQ4XE58_9ASTR